MTRERRGRPQGADAVGGSHRAEHSGKRGAHPGKLAAAGRVSFGSCTTASSAWGPYAGGAQGLASVGQQRDHRPGQPAGLRGSTISPRARPHRPTPPPRPGSHAPTAPDRTSSRTAERSLGIESSAPVNGTRSRTAATHRAGRLTQWRGASKVDRLRRNHQPDGDQPLSQRHHLGRAPRRQRGERDAILGALGLRRARDLGGHRLGQQPRFGRERLSRPGQLRERGSVARSGRFEPVRKAAQRCLQQLHQPLVGARQHRCEGDPDKVERLGQRDHLVVGGGDDSAATRCPPSDFPAMRSARSRPAPRRTRARLGPHPGSPARFETTTGRDDFAAARPTGSCPPGQHAGRAGRAPGRGRAVPCRWLGQAAPDWRRTPRSRARRTRWRCPAAVRRRRSPAPPALSKRHCC